MNVDIYQDMPYSMTYSDDSMIASYGNYISKHAANEAAIKAVRENPRLIITNFHITENKPVEENPVEQYNLAQLQIIKYKVCVRVGGFGCYTDIGEYDSVEEANNAIIEDMERNHPDFTHDDYFVNKEKRNFV